MPRGANPGERRGGRAKGTLNKRTQQQVAAVQATGMTPLEYLLSVMRDGDNSLECRVDAAAKAAPYVHPRLASLEARVSSVRDVKEMTTEELMVIAAGGSIDSCLEAKLGGNSHG